MKDENNQNDLKQSKWHIVSGLKEGMVEMSFSDHGLLFFVSSFGSNFQLNLLHLILSTHYV